EKLTDMSLLEPQQEFEDASASTARSVRKHLIDSTINRDIYSNVGKLNRYVTSRTSTGVCKTFLYKGENARDYVLFRLGRRLSVDCPLCKKAFDRQHYK
ncbi:hypothetical protein MP638_002713, partial [Amoeboaphelidium occidentale]